MTLPACRSIWLLFLVLVPGGAFCSQSGPLTTVIVWPISECRVVPKTKEPIKPVDKRTIERTKEIAAEEKRIGDIIKEAKKQAFLASQPQVDPAKDDYRRFLAEKQRMQEDPDYAAMKAPRDDFKAWKESADYRPAPKPRQDKEPSAIDCSKIIETMNRKSPPKKAPHKEITDE